MKNIFNRCNASHAEECRIVCAGDYRDKTLTGSCNQAHGDDPQTPPSPSSTDLGWPVESLGARQANSYTISNSKTGDRKLQAPSLVFL